MTETQNDEDDTMTSDHDVTTVPKDVKKRLTSELERVDSVYNPDEEEVPSGTDDEEEFERNETKTEHYGGLGPESQEADEEVFDYKVWPPPYGGTVPILQYNDGGYYLVWPKGYFKPGLVRTSFTTSDPHLLWHVLHQHVELPPSILHREIMPRWPEQLRNKTLPALMKGGYQYYLFMSQLNDAERTLLPDDMEMWDQTPISFWKGSDHLTWNITKSVDDSLQTTHAGAGGTALGGGGENTYDVVLDVEKTKDTEKSPEDCLSSKMLGLKISELGTLGVKPKLSMIKSSAQSPVNVLPCTLSKLDMDSLNKNNDN